MTPAKAKRAIEYAAKCLDHEPRVGIVKRDRRSSILVYSQTRVIHIVQGKIEKESDWNAVVKMGWALSWTLHYLKGRDRSKSAPIFQRAAAIYLAGYGGKVNERDRDACNVLADHLEESGSDLHVFLRR